MAFIRIQKYLAGLGIASRREIEKLIRKGAVTLNGEPLERLGVLINTESPPSIEINGKPVSTAKPDSEVYIFNKPAGVVTTMKDERGRKCIADFLPQDTRLYPAGRLDMDSTGLLIITNHGELTKRLTHPSYEIEKEYIVQIIPSELTDEEEREFAEGIPLSEGITGPCKIKKVKSCTYSVILKEGRKRQIKRMFRHFGKEVQELHRIRLGSLSIAGTPEGKMRKLTEKELAAILEETGLKSGSRG